MDERISKLIASLGMPKSEFAKRIFVTPAFVSQLCSGSAAPSERTIAVICNEFNVNEKWLRTGEGEMYHVLSRNEQLTAFFAAVLADETDAFRHRFCSALAELTVEEWKVAEKFFRTLTEK